MDKPLSASAKKPRALFLSPESPYPAIGGGPLRSASLLEYLSRHFSVHAIVFHQPGDPDPAGAMPLGKVDRLDVIELPGHSKDPLARMARNSVRMIRNRPPLFDRFSGFGVELARFLAGNQYDAAFVEHFWCAPYVEQLRAHSKLVLLDLHNIESAWHRSLAYCETGARALALRRFAEASLDLERRWLPEFDRLLVTSDADAKMVAAIAPQSKVTIYPNALPEIALPAKQEREEIVFSGNLEYMPNIAAIRYFHDRIWESVRSRRPGLKWKIVGKHPEAIRDIVREDPGIEVTGFVLDAVQALAAAQVAVVPVQAGSGTRIKILEAWAAQTAVVATTLGAAGLECRNGIHLLIADESSRFADAVLELLDSSHLRRQIGWAGRALYEDRYTWPAAWQRLESVLGNYVAPGPV